MVIRSDGVYGYGTGSLPPSASDGPTTLVFRPTKMLGNGETFGNLSPWDRSMLEFPQIPGGRRALGVYQLPDDLRVLDLDDPAQLVRLGLRPTQIVVRNLAVTQAWGHRIWSEADPHSGDHQWQAVSWWSYHHPVWTVLASWLRPEVVRVEPLDVAHPALLDAANALRRIISP